jgi:outer membrane protein insertion porin family
MEEKSTGELQLSAGYSSLERFIIQASITQHNFRGKGQELRATADYSSYSKSVELGFTEPYLFDKNVAIGGDIFRRDYNSFNQLGDTRQTTYSQVSTGFQIRSGVPITEFWSLAGRYGLSFDDVGLSSDYYTNGQCDPLRAGRYLCDAIGNRVTSSLGASLIFDNLDSRLHPTHGSRLTLSGDFAGLGGDVRYLRGRVEAARYYNLGSGFIFSLSGEGGYIKSLQSDPGPGVDPVRITDRFFLGEPQIRGFDIRGVGPRVRRTPYTTDANGNQVLSTDKDSISDDALGGRAYYLGHAELEIPLGAGGRELGLRPSIFIDAGAVFGLKRPNLTAFPTAVNTTTGATEYIAINEPVLLNGLQEYVVPTTDATNPGGYTTCATGYSTSLTATSASNGCVGTSVNSAVTNSISPFKEEYLGNTPRPRVSIGIGVNWNSPFGPLRIDVAKALLSAPGDDKKLVTFNVGTQF